MPESPLLAEERNSLNNFQCLYMDSTYFTTLILHKNVNCLRIYGFLLRKLSSSLRCLRTYHPLRFRSLYGLADTTGFWQVGLTFYAALSL